MAIVYVEPGTPLTVAYTRLNLHPEFNCVFVQHLAGGPPASANQAALGNTRGKADTHWKGWITPSANKECGEPGPPPLTTIAFSSDEASANDYPPVARFMIHGDWLPSVGVRCGTAWCTVGGVRGDFIAPAHAGNIPAANPGRTKRIVPGWYDEQQLAITGTGGLIAKPRASIVPDDSLDTYKIKENFDTGFVRVAVIHFVGRPTDKYLNVWEFTDGKIKEDTLYLRHFPDDHWEAKVDNHVKRFKVLRTDHSTAGHIMGTARWAWRDEDEWIWVRCEDGCCLVEPTTIS